MTARDDAPELVPIDEFCAAWNVSPQTARRWARTGRVATVRTPSGQWRFLRASMPGQQTAGSEAA